ncbi:MAG TPA: diguanylate cyclase [Geminicoccaceae bacterium]|nr:diguanylate cyclase [Geminicoccus sp.]HMU52450.1 diguanylate cyclase [Geminicoccaceae bacterium]
MRSILPDPGLPAGFSRDRLSTVDIAMDETGEGILLLDDTWRAVEANQAASRLLAPIARLVPGAPFDFARALKNAVSARRICVDPRLVQAWLDDLWAGEPGDLVMECADGRSLRLAGRFLANNRTVVMIADVTAARRREQWLEVEYLRLSAACEGLRRRVATIKSEHEEALTRARAAEARAEELERLAFSDPLTGLLNRRRMGELMEAELARVRRYGGGSSLLILDLDRFKLVNDAFGHAAGDAALCHVAEICASTLRSSDLLARWGGEELLALLPETGLGGASQLAERLRREIAARPAMHDGRVIPLTVSIGMAELTPSDRSADPIVARADEALYAAKRAGRNLVLAA